jgi:hypothetical protein
MTNVADQTASAISTLCPERFTCLELDDIKHQPCVNSLVVAKHMRAGRKIGLAAGEIVGDAQDEVLDGGGAVRFELPLEVAWRPETNDFKKPAPLGALAVLGQGNPDSAQREARPPHEKWK